MKKPHFAHRQSLHFFPNRNSGTLNILTNLPPAARHKHQQRTQIGISDAAPPNPPTTTNRYTDPICPKPQKRGTPLPHRQLAMNRDVSVCNTYNYGYALYWDARYIQEGGSFDWYQRYSALRPFIRKYIPPSSRVLMVGCGNAVMSEDMVKDGYEDIMNIDISSVAIDMMRRKYEHIPQLKYMQMDVKDMSFFPDESFDGVVDKGTLDSLMCGTNAPISAAQMLGEVSRLLKYGGIYILITYGDPSVRISHLSRRVYNWKIELYIIPRPGFQRPAGSTSAKSYLEPVPTTKEGLLPAGFVLEDPDCHYVYVCRKMDEMMDLIQVPSYPLTTDVL